MKKIFIIWLGLSFICGITAQKDESSLEKHANGTTQESTAPKLTDEDIQKALTGLGSSLLSKGNSWVRKHPVASAGLMTFLASVPFGKTFPTLKFLTIFGAFHYGIVYQDEISKQISNYRK